MVTTRSPVGIEAASALSRVVLPAPAPPLTTTLARARTAQSSSSAVPGDDTSSSATGTGTEAPDGQAGPVDGQGPDHGMDP